MSLGLRGHGRGPVGSLWERSGISARDAGGQLAEVQPWTERQLGTVSPLIFQVGKLRLWTGEVAPLKSREPGPRCGSFYLSPGCSQGLLQEESANREVVWLWLRMAFFVHSVIHSFTNVERGPIMSLRLFWTPDIALNKTGNSPPLLDLRVFGGES